MTRLYTFSIWALLLAAPLAPAATIEVGHHQLPAGQVSAVPIYVTDYGNVQALNFWAQIADGGPEISGSSIDGPDFAGIDFASGGAMFATNNGIGDQGTWPQLLLRVTALPGGASGLTGAGPSLLATLLIDTSGFTGGTWDLKLADTLNGDTNFGGQPIDITNGSITVVVPEPGSLALVAVGTMLAGRRRRNA